MNYVKASLLIKQAGLLAHELEFTNRSQDHAIVALFNLVCSEVSINESSKETTGTMLETAMNPVK